MTKKTIEELEAARRAGRARYRKLLREHGEDYIRKCQQELAFNHKILVVPNEKEPPKDSLKGFGLHLNQSSPYLLIGKKGNLWSDQAEELLEEKGIPYRYEKISTPPHPNPAHCPGADPEVRAIPTLLLDYDAEDSQGESHHVRMAIATGIDEVRKWVRATEELREQEKANDV